MGLAGLCCGSSSSRSSIRNRPKKDGSTKHPLDHVFSTRRLVIRKSCDQCSSFIWGKAYVCSSCKMVCHRGCLAKISRHCPTSVPGKGVEACSPQILGEDLSRSANVTELAPMIMGMLLRHVELNGLCTEGIYRIPGAASQVRKLRQQLENDPRAVCLGEFDVHSVTGLIKQWLRQLPEPLVPFEHYSGLLHAMELPETSQLAHIYEVLDMLPFAHLQILERLISHMVRVASEEASNCMSLHVLAIIFAPCLLRSPESADLLQVMAEMMKATACLELILNEQMRCQKEFMEPEGKTL